MTLLIIIVSVLAFLQMIFLVMFVMYQRKSIAKDLEREKQEKRRMMLDASFVGISLISLLVEGANRKAKTNAKQK